MCDENLKRSSDQSELGNGATKDAKVARMEIIQGVSSIKLTQLAALNEKISILEEKLDTYETTNKELKVALTANKTSFDGLNSKIDKLVRLLSDSTEKQSKMTKELSSLTKMMEKQEEKSRPSPNASMGVFLQNLHTGKQKNAKKPVFEGPEPEPLPAPIKRPPVNPLDELKWGQNTYLIGDYIFNIMKEVDDIKEQMKKMESLNFSIYKKNKDKETIGRLFDRSRNQVLFALPNNVQKVIISIGRINEKEWN
jgi:chromosome segregation ATPase